MPWVPTDSEEPQDLEEEERRERMTGLLDRYAARKRKRQVISSSESDPSPVYTAEPSLPATDGQPVTDEFGGPCHHHPLLFRTRANRWNGTGRGWPIRIERGRSGSASYPSNPTFRSGEEQPRKSKHMRPGLPRPHQPDQVITQNYLPPRGPEPPRVEVSAPGVEEVKDILSRWEPFHLGAFAADRLDNLYPHIYRVPVVARGMGLREDYSVTLPASTPNEDFLQIIDDGIQVRNSNFVQSTKMVR